MDIYEYQAKKIFKNFGIDVPVGLIAYTPQEAKDAAAKISKKGPWVVKAQIKAGARDVGKFLDKRAGRKGGIRLSKTLDDVYENADKMLDNMLITNQTSAKGRLVSRVYIEEYIKVKKKYYLGFVIDRISASVILLLAPLTRRFYDDIISISQEEPYNILKINLGLQKEFTPEQLTLVADFLRFGGNRSQLKRFLNDALKVFYHYDATMLEINPFGLRENNKICALDAKILFDENALYRHKDILELNNDDSIDERETTAEKYGFLYKELDTGIGLISNGNGLAFNTMNEASTLGLSTACFLNIKGGVDRDKITAGIKLIMTNPKVDGIFINILGGFTRCNFIADGIISVANDLGLNIPLVARFEGTNKDEAIKILLNSGLPIKLAPDTQTGLLRLKEAIEEDL